MNISFDHGETKQKILCCYQRLLFTSNIHFVVCDRHSRLIKYYDNDTNETDRAVACAFTNGYKGSKHKGFTNLGDAESYMEENSITRYHVISDLEERSSERMPGNRSYYAVANGRQKGIYPFFQYVHYLRRNLY